jgi:hypothetical protein
MCSLHFKPGEVLDLKVNPDLQPMKQSTSVISSDAQIQSRRKRCFVEDPLELPPAKREKPEEYPPLPEGNDQERYRRVFSRKVDRSQLYPLPVLIPYGVETASAAGDTSLSLPSLEPQEFSRGKLNFI